MDRLKLIAIGVVVLFACLTTCTNNNMNDQVEDEVDMEIYEFNYEGHEYLIFSEFGNTISVIHNPGCSCGKQE